MEVLDFRLNQESNRIELLNKIDKLDYENKSNYVLSFNLPRTKEKIPRVVRIESMTKTRYIPITKVLVFETIIPDCFNLSKEIEICIISRVEGQHIYSNKINLRF